MRLPGWESRLDALIEAARHAPYVLGEHDCFRLACRVVEALTGLDRWPDCRGYRSRREALACLARHGSFEGAGDWFFAGPRRPAATARRGDILALKDAAGQMHLAVCLGARAAGLTEKGLAFVRTSDCVCCWRVG